MEQHDILIIGAGITGLTAATELQKSGRRVTVFERWPRLGGRMSTGSIGGDIADDGAQFFTIRHPDFQMVVNEWQAAGLIDVWGYGWSDGSASAREDGYPRYIVRGGMQALPEYLAKSLDVRVNMVVVAATPINDGWVIKTAVGDTHRARRLIMTTPVPQSLAILDAGKTILPSADYEALRRIRYAPSLTGVFQIDGDVNFPKPGAVQQPAQAVVWMADNQRKGVSNTRLITVQASPGFSEQLFDASDEDALTELMNVLWLFLGKTAVGQPAVVLESYLKRWRYALPTMLHPERCLSTAVRETNSPIIFAGDAFKEPRVEGAVLSGKTAVGTISSFSLT